MSRTVYLASPFSGDVDANTAYARKCMKDSLMRGEAPFAPHLLYTQVLDDKNQHERTLGMRAGSEWMSGCDAFVAYVDRGWSRGMEAEIALAVGLGIPTQERLIESCKVCGKVQQCGIWCDAPSLDEAEEAALQSLEVGR